MRFFGNLHGEFGRDFVVGISDAQTGIAEDLYCIADSSPDLEMLARVNRATPHPLKGRCNCVYVAQSDQTLGLEAGVTTTRPIDRAGGRAGIDTVDCFFEMPMSATERSR